MERDEFVRVFGPVFEETPGIAQVAWLQRPFQSKAELVQAMMDVMRSRSPSQQLALIQAHPDLGTKAHMADASVQEQSAAGLSQLSSAEFKQFQQLNQDYKAKFQFPFIVAVKHHNKASILAAFQQRLQNDREAEQATALAQIAEIARLRLDDLIQ